MYRNYSGRNSYKSNSNYNSNYNSRYNRYPKKRYNRYTKVNNQEDQNSYMNIASQALKTAKWVANLVNAEYKFYDDIVTGAVTNYNGSLVSSLMTIPQDVTANGRTGDSIKLKNLTWRFEIKQGSHEEVIRIILFNDKQDEISGVNQLLQTVGTSMGVYSPKNEDNKYNTKILFDKDFKVTNEYPITKIEEVIRLNFHADYVAGTTTVSNNVLKVAIIGQNVSNGATYSHYTRLTYLDN